MYAEVMVGDLGPGQSFGRELFLFLDAYCSNRVRILYIYQYIYLDFFAIYRRTMRNLSQLKREVNHSFD